MAGYCEYFITFSLFCLTVAANCLFFSYTVRLTGFLRVSIQEILTMKLRYAVAATMLMVATSSSAGTIYPQVIDCVGGFYRYAIEWSGGWSETLIFMEDKHKDDPVWAWEFFIGYLAPTGKYTPTSHHQQYRMQAQPSSGSAYTDSNVATIMRIKCSVNP